MPGAPRTSTWLATAGKKTVKVEQAPTPPEVPWWMCVHGTEPGVTNLVEVMEQFLDEDDMCNLQVMAERAAKKVDVRPSAMIAVIPAVNTQEIEALYGWNDHIQKFLHYRGLVQQKHDHKESRKVRRRAKSSGSDGSSSSEESAAPSDSPEFWSSASARGGAAAVGKGAAKIGTLKLYQDPRSSAQMPHVILPEGSAKVSRKSSLEKFKSKLDSVKTAGSATRTDEEASTPGLAASTPTLVARRGNQPGASPRLAGAAKLLVAPGRVFSENVAGQSVSKFSKMNSPSNSASNAVFWGQLPEVKISDPFS